MSMKKGEKFVNFIQKVEAASTGALAARTVAQIEANYGHFLGFHPVK